MIVTNTAGEYSKPPHDDYNPGEYHNYQESPEPVSIKAACITIRVLGPSFSPTQIHLRFHPPTQPPVEEYARRESGVLLLHYHFLSDPATLQAANPQLRRLLWYNLLEFSNSVEHFDWYMLWGQVN